MSLTPAEQRIYEELLDKPATTAHLSKRLDLRYHTLYTHLSNMSKKGYLARRPADNGYEYFVPDNLRQNGGRFHFLDTELDVEQVMLTIANLNFIQSHMTKANLAIGHLFYTAIIPQPNDLSNPMKTIRSTRQVLSEYLGFLDQISRLDRERLLEVLGRFHPRLLESMEERWQELCHKEPQLILSSLENMQQKMGEDAHWTEIETK